MGQGPTGSDDSRNEPISLQAEGQKPTLPNEVSDPLRRRFLKALGAGSAAAATVSLAGCTELLTTQPDDPVEIDYEEIDRFTPDWIPKQIVKPLNVQVAFNSETIFFRFNWEQPDPGGWYHDYIVYENGSWTRYSSPDPWVAADPDPSHIGFYEDRVTFLLDDGSVKGFEKFGGWLTVHMGTRHLPGAATSEEVEAHPHLGDDNLGRSDVRKFIPQSRSGDWWESPWDDIKPQSELDEMLERGEFVELAMFRSHRSAPMRHGTDHHVLDYRHGDDGTDSFDTQDWDEETGPEYMYDPDIVEDGALDIEKLNNADYPHHTFFDEVDEWVDEEDPYYIHEDWLVEFDPDLAEWEGAAIPRRPLREPEGSAADWRCDSQWTNGEWTVDMWRALDTGHIDNKVLESGGLYTWAPAVHHGFNSRWHWVAYPYTLGLGPGTDADIRATPFEGAVPNWDEVPTDTLPLIYPGQADWTWLTSRQHRGYHLVRTDQMSIWDVHDDPRRMAALLLGMELDEAPRR